MSRTLSQVLVNLVAASGMLCIATAVGTASSAAAAANEFGHSFEHQAEIAVWKCQPGITIERTSTWASDGTSSLQINVPAGTPWFGIQRDVSLDEFRRHEFLEFDIHALTDVDTFTFTMRAAKFQDFMLTHDRLKPGETIHVRILLTDNEIVRHGDTASISLWMVNHSAAAQRILVDNIRLTGRGGEGRRIETLLSRIKASGIDDGQTRSLRAECEALLAGTVTAEDVERTRGRWGELLTRALNTVADRPFHVVCVSPLEKVRRQDILADLPVKPAQRGLRLEMARNEYESGQLVFLASRPDGMATLEVTVGDLVGPGDATIPATDIELRMVDEVDIGGTTQFPGERLTGLWPDPLMPSGPFTVKPGALQCAWLTVRSRAATPPGSYEGRISVRDGTGTVLTLPLAVTVWDFVIPEKASLKTNFCAWSHNWATFYNYGSYPRFSWFHHASFDDIPKDHQLAAIDFFADYRATLQGMITWGMIHGKPVPPVLQPDGSLSLDTAPPGAASYAEIAAAAMKNDGGLVIGELGGQTRLHLGETDRDPAVAAHVKDYLSLVVRHAGEQGRADSLYLYLLDEPHTKPGGWEAVLAEARFVKSTAPVINTFVSSGVLLPTPDKRALYKDIDVFCMLWDRTPSRDAQALRASGKEVWWYGANVTYAPYPNWAVHQPNLSPRVIPLLSYRFQMDGVLNWAATLFNDDNSFPQDGPRWPERPWSMKGWMYQPGEGHVCYPAPDGSFWPSIRLANWRDGMEDYEYLKLLQNALPRLTEAQRERAQAVLSLTSMVTAPYDYSTDPVDFARLRRQIAALLTEP
jgi:hypothetical protein